MNLRMNLNITKIFLLLYLLLFLFFEVLYVEMLFTEMLFASEIQRESFLSDPPSRDESINYKDLDTNTSNKTTEEVINLRSVRDEEKDADTELQPPFRLEQKAAIKNKDDKDNKDNKNINDTKKFDKNKVVAKKLVGIFYLNRLFANIHQRPSSDSNSVLAIACAHPLKVYEDPAESTHAQWALVNSEKVDGYIMKAFISEQRNNSCFQNIYPQFFNLLNLDVTQIYYWGRLQDHFISGKSKVK
ncbi:MAG: hypothetical protein HQK49_01135 [Oligoflexia bacterium]|nr:hypothetical protein [Oligoflexia bacterium]